MGWSCCDASKEHSPRWKSNRTVWNSFALLFLQEATTILGAASVALANMGRALPVLVPVHDNSRDAVWGVAVINGRTVHFDSDSIYGSHCPSHLTNISGQLQALTCQVAKHSPKAGMHCLALAEAHGQTGKSTIDLEGKKLIGDFQVCASKCISYNVPLPMLKHALVHFKNNPENEVGFKSQINSVYRGFQNVHILHRFSKPVIIVSRIKLYSSVEYLSQLWNTCILIICSWALLGPSKPWVWSCL